MNIDFYGIAGECHCATAMNTLETHGDHRLKSTHKIFFLSVMVIDMAHCTNSIRQSENEDVDCQWQSESDWWISEVLMKATEKFISKLQRHDACHTDKWAINNLEPKCEWLNQGKTIRLGPGFNYSENKNVSNLQCREMMIHGTDLLVFLCFGHVCSPSGLPIKLLIYIMYYCIASYHGKSKPWASDHDSMIIYI